MGNPIDPIALEPSLVVAPDVPFARIDAALRSIGWSRDDRATVTPPLIAGEPELAGWRHGSGKPLITYTFNPVVHLRVLEVATLAPEQRAQLAAALPLLDRADLEQLLAASAPRARLCGIFAAREIEALDLLERIDRLKADSERVVRDAAGDAVTRLEQIARARVHALATAKVIAASAEPLLEELARGDAELVRSLEPTPPDFGRLFDADVADEIAAAYAVLWKQPPRVRPGERYPELEVVAAPAGMLRSHNELSREFPRGYRSLAGWLRPERVWLCWRYVPVGGGPGVAFDGLASIDGRWVWCPKPYRVVGEILARRARH